MIALHCQMCGEVFQTSLAEAQRGKARSCSLKCGNLFQSIIKTVGDGAKERKNRKRRERRADPEMAKIERARDVVRRALENGLLMKPLECPQCGNANDPIEAHHEDYNIPLFVKWFCQPCHRQRDLQLGLRPI